MEKKKQVKMAGRERKSLTMAETVKPRSHSAANKRDLVPGTNPARLPACEH